MIEIRVKLMGILKVAGEPAAGRPLHIPAGTTIRQVLEQLQIGPEQVHVCTLNSCLQRDLDQALSDGDELVILPPAIGG